MKIYSTSIYIIHNDRKDFLNYKVGSAYLKLKNFSFKEECKKYQELYPTSGDIRLCSRYSLGINGYKVIDCGTHHCHISKRTRTMMASLIPDLELWSFNLYKPYI